MISSPGKKVVVLAVLAAAAAAALALAPFTGLSLLGFSEVFGGSDPMIENLFWNRRVPPVLTAFLAGAGLSVCGMAFQAMFRNPLATPFTLGVASGASLGAALAVRLGLVFSVLGLSSTSVFAFVGALAAISLVYGITRLRRGFSSATMLLAGVAVSFFFSSVILFVQYMSGLVHSLRIVRWMMGGLEVTGYGDVLGVLPFVVVGAATILLFSRELNLLTSGEDIAASRGVAVRRVKLAVFLMTSLTVAGVVAVCGPIGFVGMMVPHICRLVIGSDHRYLAPASLLFGGTFLVVCDRLAQGVVEGVPVPVGIVTALLGGPFFLWLLVRRGAREGL